MSTSAILAEDLSFGYAKNAPPVLRQVSLNIPEGSVCAVLGPNGSGKTTLLNLFLGMLTPREGRVTVSGVSQQKRAGPKMRRIIGMVPQEETVPFELSVFEYILLGRAPYLGLFEQPGQEERELALEALQRVGIVELKDRSVPSLSGGERQLAMVARVLCQESRILLMDEPTSHLDLGNTRQVLRLMRSLRQDGKTVVFTTHDPNAASAVADHVVLVHRGSILSEGSPGSVLNAGSLSELYGFEVEVVDLRGRPVVLMELTDRPHGQSQAHGAL